MYLLPKPKTIKEQDGQMLHDRRKRRTDFRRRRGWRALWCGDLLPDRTAVWRDTALCTDSGCPRYAKPWLLF